MDARHFEKRPVAHDGRFLVIHAERQAFGWYLPAVHVRGEMADVVMAQVMGVRGHQAQEVRVLHHGEDDVLRQGSQHGVVYGQGLRSARERERLLFDLRHVISVDGVVAEGGAVRQQDCGARSHAVHQQLGVEKLEGGLRFRVLIHQVETGLCLAQSDLYADAGGQETRHVKYVAVKQALQLDLLALLHLVPPGDEARVFRVFGRGVAWQEIPVVQVPEAVGQLRDGGVATIR